MTTYPSPFQFGTLATEDNFIDRVEDRALLKQLLSSHINVIRCRAIRGICSSCAILFGVLRLLK